ncbi:MAG: WG repeat-containing protein, partial [Candidatus Wallbacteria bacterium]|nr:WG repeat-containing protein [Candidatus Wallbacteria bacterium]
RPLSSSEIHIQHPAGEKQVIPVIQALPAKPSEKVTEEVSAAANEPPPDKKKLESSPMRELIDRNFWLFPPSGLEAAGGETKPSPDADPTTEISVVAETNDSPIEIASGTVETVIIEEDEDHKTQHLSPQKSADPGLCPRYSELVRKIAAKREWFHRMKPVFAESMSSSREVTAAFLSGALSRMDTMETAENTDFTETHDFNWLFEAEKKRQEPIVMNSVPRTGSEEISAAETSPVTIECTLQETVKRLRDRFSSNLVRTLSFEDCSGMDLITENTLRSYYLDEELTLLGTDKIDDQTDLKIDYGRSPCLAFEENRNLPSGKDAGIDLSRTVQESQTLGQLARTIYYRVSNRPENPVQGVAALQCKSPPSMESETESVINQYYLEKSALGKTLTEANEKHARLAEQTGSDLGRLLSLTDKIDQEKTSALDQETESLISTFYLNDHNQSLTPTAYEKTFSSGIDHMLADVEKSMALLDRTVPRAVDPSLDETTKSMLGETYMRDAGTVSKASRIWDYWRSQVIEGQDALKKQIDTRSSASFRSSSEIDSVTGGELAEFYLQDKPVPVLKNSSAPGSGFGIMLAQAARQIGLISHRERETPGTPAAREVTDMMKSCLALQADRRQTSGTSTDMAVVPDREIDPLAMPMLGVAGSAAIPDQRKTDIRIAESVVAFKPPNNIPDTFDPTSAPMTGDNAPVMHESGFSRHLKKVLQEKKDHPAENAPPGRKTETVPHKIPVILPQTPAATAKFDVVKPDSSKKSSLEEETLAMLEDFFGEELDVIDENIEHSAEELEENGLDPGIAYQFREGLAVIRLKGLYGFMDRDGRVVIDPEFTEALDFSEGAAAVKSKDKWGYIDRTGFWLKKPVYDEARSFSCGMARVSEAGKWGFLDLTGETAFECLYDEATDFANGTARVRVGKDWTVLSLPQAALEPMTGN